MRGFDPSGRPDYFDRNSVMQSGQYSATAVAPHGTTTRWTYTTPAATKAYVESVYGSLLRDVAPTTAALASLRVRYLQSGGGTQVILQAAENLSATVGLQYGGPAGPLALLLAGDTISAVTDDASTAGSYLYRTGYKLTEFTA